MAAGRLYIARDGDRQRDPRAASGHAPACVRSAQNPVARRPDRPRDGARPAVLRRQEPRLLDPPVDRLERLFLPAHPVRLRQQPGLDAAGPYAPADFDRLFADAADGGAVPAPDQDAADLDAGPVARRGGHRFGALSRSSRRGASPPSSSRGSGPRASIISSAILLDFALLTAWTALYYGINYFLLLEDEIRQRELLEGQASTAQLAMLRYQLNPHFLFNTLNSISTLVLLKQTERANAMLARLSSFLRYTLANEPTAKVTLAQEVETLKLYLEIEKMRFEDRLRPHFKIESETIGARLPSLLLQPLIENAIKYAVTPAENGADIWITAKPEGQAVRIEVADNGNGEGARNLGEPSRPESDWRTFATDCRRPMAAHIVSRPDRTTAGALALSSKFPSKPETLFHEHPDRSGRRRTPGHAGAAAAAPGVRRRRGGRHRGQRARGDPPDQDPQARPRLPRHPDAGLRRILGDPGADGRRTAAVRVRHRLWRACAARVRRAGGRLSDEAGRRGPARRDHGPGSPAAEREAQRGGSGAAEGGARPSMRRRRPRSWPTRRPKALPPTATKR